uniref:BTB domain-containing protein n=1 Tax=Branchiostoma floridae TaxID=7739 RepID=C3Y7A3_BRAFL|eukprot:XP_002607721.1 hypothetical protein BRAFLDRAFT_82832 [Branchiostoma floridae]
MASEEANATSTTTTPECAVLGDWVRLNVGGTMFETTRTTLARLNSQFLDRLLAEDSGFSPPADGVYRIDRDPDVFRVLLNYARNGRLLLSPQVTSDMLSAAAEFYMLRQGALEVIEGLSKETSSARVRGRRYKVPAEISIQCEGTDHHNGLIFQNSRNYPYQYQRRCSIDKCTAKMFDEEPQQFRQMCISCHRYVVVEQKPVPAMGTIVGVEWCHKCLRCLDCQETICLP